MNKQRELARNILPLIDLTSLNLSDTAADITALCKKAVTPYGEVAAVCVYPQFVKLARQYLRSTKIKVATVANFPSGARDASTVYAEIERALCDGADEIDLVIPYNDYLKANRRAAIALMRDSKKLCGVKQLKTILETGVLIAPDLILAASMDAIFAGTDFLKTSTGKVPVNATFEAAKIMLTVIRGALEYTNRAVGFKAAGGVRTIEDAEQYLQIAKNIMGADWIMNTNFRFGASALLDDVLRVLDA